VAFRLKRRTTRGPREENIWSTLGYIMDAVGSSKIFEYPYFVTAAKLAHVNKLIKRVSFRLTRLTASPSLSTSFCYNLYIVTK
jgi:hypothetical protein